ncbi:MAG: hypothetical protein L6R37_003098 [Teloschistes peruensis]|nr:MAG: hypothetical protein L6R37_003098 [Teloschistes peruensis]
MAGIRMSRNSSTSTIQQIQKPSPTIMQQSGFESTGVAFHPAKARDGPRRSTDTASKEKLVGSASSKADDSTSSSSDSETAPPMSRSRAYMRRPRHSTAKTALGPLSDNDDQDDDDADSPPFLPFSDPKAAKAQSSSSPPSTDPNATVRMAHQKRAVPSTKPLHTLAPQPPLNSSSSSAQSQPQKPPRHHNHHQNPRDPPKSPAHMPTTTTEQQQQQPVSALSPRQRRVTGKEGSEGTPSMGSSFSDLDDASVTQSALEEALLAQETEKGGGGVASRMSTISQALRSRYL